MTTLVGHRANTWAKIDWYLKLGVRILEVDLRGSDGVLRIEHGYGSIMPATLREAFLRRLLSYFSRRGGPRDLGELVRRVGSGVELWLDIKDDLPPGLVADSLRALGLERSYVSSKYHGLLRGLKERLPTLKVYPTIQERPLSASLIAGVVGGDGVAIEIGYLSRELVEELHGGGYGVAVWVVNDVDQALMASEIGVDLIITDRPDLLKLALGGEFKRGLLRRLYERLVR